MSEMWIVARPIGDGTGWELVGAVAGSRHLHVVMEGPAGELLGPGAYTPYAISIDLPDGAGLPFSSGMASEGGRTYGKTLMSTFELPPPTIDVMEVKLHAGESFLCSGELRRA